MNILYDGSNEAETAEDIALLAEGMRLLEYDYLGGHGSRGYGKVKFSDLTLCVAVGELPPAILAEFQALLDEV